MSIFLTQPFPTTFFKKKKFFFNFNEFKVTETHKNTQDLLKKYSESPLVKHTWKCLIRTEINLTRMYRKSPQTFLLVNTI